MKQSALENKARPLINPDEFMGLIRRGTVKEVTTDRDIVVEFGSGTNAGNRVTIPSTRVYTFSGRYRELPHVGDTCIIAFVNGRPDDAVILGFNSGEGGEHDSFGDIKDRRITLPQEGYVQICGRTGRLTVNLIDNSDIRIGGKAIENEVNFGVDFTLRAAAAITFLAKQFIINLRETLKLSAESIRASCKDLFIGASRVDASITGDASVVVGGILSMESDSIKLGGDSGAKVARVGDEITIEITEFNGATNATATRAIKGIITTGSKTVSASD